jgi:hypothetical protein
MTYDRKMLGRLAFVFGISAFSYGIAGIVATHARDQLMTRLQMRHEMQSQRDGSSIGADGVPIRVAAGEARIEGATGSIDQSK